MRKSLITLALVAVAGVQAHAVSIPIVNPSFEADGNLGGPGGWSDSAPTGWVDPNGGSNGNFMENISGFASSGAIHLGFDQGSDSGLGLVYQDLSTSWAPNTTYTLTVGVGNRGGFGAGVGRFGFASSTDAAPAGSTLFAPSVYFSDVDTAVTPNPATDSFSDLTVSFTTGAVAPAGSIRISTQRTSGPRLHVDNFRLDAVPVLVPEPTTLAGLALASTVLLRRRRRA